MNCERSRELPLAYQAPPDMMRPMVCFVPRFAHFAVLVGALICVSTPRGGAAQDGEGLVLRCAVEGSPSSLRGKSLCEQVAHAVGRSMQWVDDARRHKGGETVQILRDDVQWTVILLRNGVVRSWTRVSADDARGRESTFLARALRSLLKAAPKPTEPCLRLEPKDRSARAPDLVYPWAELKPCVRQVVDVVDPWWTPR